LAYKVAWAACQSSAATTNLRVMHRHALAWKAHPKSQKRRAWSMLFYFLRQYEWPKYP